MEEISQSIEYRYASIFRKFPIDESCSGFLQDRFSFRVYVFIPLMRRLLPHEMFLYYFERQKEKMWTQLFREIESKLEEKICFERSPISNSGPRYFAWRIYFLSKDNSIKGFGHSLHSDEEALSKALGEFLERYFLNWKFLSTTEIDQKLKTIREVKSSINIQNMPLYLPWQKDKILDRFIANNDIETARMIWTRATSLFFSFKKKMVPVQKIAWQYPFLSNESVLCHPTTNGGGGGYTKEQSILSALYELVERDSFMCHWLLRIRPSRILTESISIHEVKDLDRSLRANGIDLHFLNTTTVLGIPSVCAILTKQAGDRMQVAVGSASGFSVKKLFLNSAIEAMVVGGTFVSGQNDNEEIQKYIEKPFTAKELNRQKRLELWRSGAFRASEIKWILEGPEEDYVKFKEEYGLFENITEEKEMKVVKNVFRNIVKRYSDSYHPYIFTVPRKKLLSSLNYFVSKAVVSSLFTLYLNEQMATLDVSGLKHWRDEAHKHDKGENWCNNHNPIPHPFP